MTELSPEQWQEEADAEAKRLGNVLDLGELADNASQMDDPFGLDGPTTFIPPTEYHIPGSPLDLSDDEAASPDAKVGHRASTQYIGAVADSMQEALDRGRASGIYKKSPWPWKR